MTTTPAISTIRWPERYKPESSAVFVHNEIVIPARPEVVWAWLLRAEDWPEWYAHARHIHFLSHAGPDLRDRSRLRWRTFGVKITSKVLEFEAARRIAWDEHGIGVEGYQIWTLTELGDGTTRVVTEETQTGWLATLAKRWAPDLKRARHQEWLEGLSVKAQNGMPPARKPMTEIPDVAE